MGGISFKQRGDFHKTDRFLSKLGDWEKTADRILRHYGREGVHALSSATPRDTGKTASSWWYEIEKGDGYCNIVWTNSNIQDGRQVALLIQYGHGTGTGGYVKGIDYINPALRPTFEMMANAVWKEVTNL